MVTRSNSHPIAKQLAYAGLPVPSHGVSCLPVIPVATRLVLMDALLGPSVTAVPHPPALPGSSLRDSWQAGATVVVFWQATLKTGHSSIHRCATRPRGLSHVAAWVGSSPNARMSGKL